MPFLASDISSRRNILWMVHLSLSLPFSRTLFLTPTFYNITVAASTLILPLHPLPLGFEHFPRFIRFLTGIYGRDSWMLKLRSVAKMWALDPTTQPNCRCWRRRRLQQNWATPVFPKWWSMSSFIHSFIHSLEWWWCLPRITHFTPFTHTHSLLSICTLLYYVCTLFSYS